MGHKRPNGENAPGSHAQRKRRFVLLDQLGIKPTYAPRVRKALDSGLGEARRQSPSSVTVLDAGCGHKSPLIGFRGRIDRLVGVDIHEPEAPLAYLDEFAIVDLCSPDASLSDNTFDLILSNFTLEHFEDPQTALVNFHRWLRPGGILVVTTVNRRHPFVAVYLGLPDGPRHWLQPYVKKSAADAHPLVGACNDPRAVHAALATAGFERIELEMVANLAHAWGRRLPSFALGMVGDLLAQSIPSRRSTIVAVAHKPGA